MSITHVKAPTSRLNFGHARCDITPPVGIYHRMWGAARHDQATGVHRALQADIVIAEPLGGDASQRQRPDPTPRHPRSRLGKRSARPGHRHAFAFALRRLFSRK